MPRDRVYKYPRKPITRRILGSGRAARSRESRRPQQVLERRRIVPTAGPQGETAAPKVARSVKPAGGGWFYVEGFDDPIRGLDAAHAAAEQ